MFGQLLESEREQLFLALVAALILVLESLQPECAMVISQDPVILDREIHQNASLILRQ